MRGKRALLPALDNLEVDGLRLACRAFEPAGAPRGAVLFIHGWGGAQDANDVRLARQLVADGFRCFTFDLAGHGRSEGRAEDFTVAQFLEQALAAYDRLPASTPAYLCGSSFGAYLALLLSTQRPVAGLSLRVPANYPDDIFAGPAVAAYIASQSPREWRSEARGPAENRALSALAAFPGPVQLLAAGRDETIPCQTTENFISAARPGALQYHLLAEATHTLYAIPAMRREAYRLVRDWLLAQTGRSVARD
jgi:alpha-beta hydrolase superfamily lysophospholipase